MKRFLALAAAAGLAVLDGSLPDSNLPDAGAVSVPDERFDERPEDLSAEPTGSLLDMMTLAASRDQIAAQYAERFSLPDRNDLDGRLIIGSILFGIGWGIAGLCPGPGLAALAIAPASAAIFVAAMLAGMLIVRMLEGHG